jgi:DNA-directed RNA polymerase subunit RPC12/RpoP
VPIFCNTCNREFDFDHLPADRPIFCPDCGSPAIIIDKSELLKTRKSGNTSSSNTVKAPTAEIRDHIDPMDKEKTIPYGRARHNRRMALVLSSVGAIIGIVGIAHLYMKSRLRGICFLIGGFFVYLLAVVNLNPPDTGYDPDVRYVGVFFLVVYILIWLWQFIDIRKRLNPLANRNPT